MNWSLSTEEDNVIFKYNEIYGYLYGEKKRYSLGSEVEGKYPFEHLKMTHKYNLRIGYDATKTTKDKSYLISNDEALVVATVMSSDYEAQKQLSFLYLLIILTIIYYCFSF